MSALLVALVVLAGCGGSSTKSTSSTSASRTTATAASSGAAPASSGPLKLTDRVIRTGEFPGFAPPSGENPTVSHAVADWLAIQGGGTTAADDSRLRRLRFIAGAREDLVAAGHSDRGGLSVVEQFPTAAAARDEVVANAKRQPADIGFRAFAVPGIPGARGFSASGSGGGGYNVVWADGPFYYLVGAGYSPGAVSPPTSAQVVAAARALYARVHARAA